MKREELKQIRAKLGLSQLELAQQIGVARNTITRWEMGLRHIPEPVARLVQYLAREVIAGRQEETRRPNGGHPRC